jgi:nucleoid DNA-binding protein
MRKRDIINKISQAMGIKQVVVKEVVHKTLDIIINSLKNGERIELRNFGVFYTKKRKKRMGRNPRTGQVVPVPEKIVVAFKPGLEMKQFIK